MPAATIKPTLATITINGTPVSGPDVMQCRVTLSCDNKAGDCDIILNDSAGTYDGLYKGGQSVSVAIYKAGGGASTTIFAGVIDDLKPSHVSSKIATIDVHATDLSWVLMQRLVSAVFITLAPNYIAGPTVDQIVIQLIMNPQLLVTNQLVLNNTNFGPTGLSAVAQSSGGYVQPSPVHVQNQTFYNQPINDCLQELANLGLANWYVDPQGNLHFFIISNTGMAGTWASTQQLTTALIKDMDIEDQFQNLYNVVMVVGGSIDQPDQSNPAAVGPYWPPVFAPTSYVFTQSGWFAMQFTAGQTGIDYLGLYLYMVQGNALVPVVPLSGDIRADNGGTPQGGAIWANWQLNYTGAPNGIGNAGPVYIPCSTPLQPGNKYWVVVYETAQNPNETGDGYYLATYGSGLTTATSSDGSTWTAHGSSVGMTFCTFFSNQILAVQVDAASVALYGPRETAITDTTIPSTAAASQMAQAYLNILAKPKRILTIESVAPDTIILPGQSVYVTDPARGVTGWFMALDITYQIKDVSCFEVNYTLAAYLTT